MRLPRFPALALAALSAPALLPGAAALAETASAGPGTVAEIDDPSRVLRVAEALQREPVYVSHLVDPQPDRGELRAINARVSEAFDGEVPLYVVLYAAPPTDETGGQPTLFLHALHEMSGADGVYVAVTTDGRHATAAFDSPVTPVLDGERLPDSFRPLETVSAIVEAVEESPRNPVAATPLTRDAEPEVEQRTFSPLSRSATLWNLAFPGVLTGLLVAAPYLWWSSRTLSPAPDQGSGPWFANAGRGSRWRVRRRLDGELRSLRREFESAPSRHAGLPRAREAYDAAGLIAATPGLPVTALVCGMVLARHGRRALTRPRGGDGLPPCQVNPLHAPAAERRTFYLDGRLRKWRVCPACFDAQVRTKQALYLRHDGARVHVSDLDDPWAETALNLRDPFARARSLLGVRS
ncbi:hypothetical protein [Nocardiopsis sp. NPDC006938]|uniref:hypothetical protein n=1 Tax=Nocardiopsis sp. NPDC006938 TaxID=3364337 RepID=UPI00367933E6